MEKQISFSHGVNLTPYGEISPDGQLAASVNLETHGAALRPAEMDANIMYVANEGVELILVHSTAQYKHLIFIDAEGRLYWSLEQDNIDVLTDIGVVSGYKSINSIGNTIIVNRDGGISYFLWKDDNYTNMGNMPELELSFGLQIAPQYRQDHDFPVDLAEQIPWKQENVFSEFSEANKNAVTSQVMPRLNQFVAEEITKLGRFIYPFFVRYGYRLFNGTIVRHSAPVLMIPNSATAPMAILRGLVGDGRLVRQLSVTAYAASGQLDYNNLTSADMMERLNGWEDIITSVCIFISLPISTYQSNGRCERINRGLDNYSVGRYDFMNKGTYEVYHTNRFTLESFHNGYIQSGQRDAEDFVKDLTTTSNFYLAKEIKIKELVKPGEEPALIEFPESYLANLQFKERMNDDFGSHDSLEAGYTFTYNQRLILANIKKYLYQGFSASSMMCRCTGFKGIAGAHKVYCDVYIKAGGKDLVLRDDGSKYLFPDLDNCKFLYFFYPDTRAYKICLHADSYAIDVPLTAHELLNGAYAWLGFDTLYNKIQSPDTPTPDADRYILEPNTFYTSEVNNPFFFPPNGVNIVGIGEILGLSTVTTALSQGQFGQFPLMVFCSDGNYAMSVSSEGLFTGVSAMPRDVCTNPSSITQMEGAVIFVSARGVMVANGSTIESISDKLIGVNDDVSDIVEQLLPDGPINGLSKVEPVEFFQHCLVAYDYARGRMIFFEKNSADNVPGWELNLKDGTWNQIDYGGARSTLNVYPYSYVSQNVDGKNVIHKLNRPYTFTDNGTVKGLIVTRPCKLDSLQQKSISQLSVEGVFLNTPIVGIFGSNDMLTWHFLGKSRNTRVLMRGHFFKFFRFSIETDISKAESISGMRIEYAVKPESRFR